jgi:hypothetical protein
MLRVHFARVANLKLVCWKILFPQPGREPVSNKPLEAQQGAHLTFPEIYSTVVTSATVAL